jgi:tetratricopeptide (TPR) repeat protein
VSPGRQAEVAGRKGYEFIISGSVSHYFDGGKTRDSRVDQELRIVSATTGEALWFAGATATGKAIQDEDRLIYVAKGKEGPPPQALMAVNAGKFRNLVSWESPRYRDLREDMRLVDTGYNFLRERQYDAARSYFEAALRVQPKNPYAYLNLGVVCEAQGQVEDAVRMYRKVIELEPDEVVKESTDPTKIGSSLESLAKDNLTRLGYPPD